MFILFFCKHICCKNVVKNNDIINNFIIAYVGDGKVLTKVPRYEVAFWAQRSVQEFSYDVFHSEKAIEIELSPTKTISLPGKPGTSAGKSGEVSL